MATYSAAEGSISVAGNTLGELKSFNFTQTADTKDTTNLASTSKTYVAGTLAFSGSAEAFWDHADSGQDALPAGALVAVIFYPNGTEQGKKIQSGNVIVSEVNTSLATDGQVEASFSFTGTGVLTESTVA